MEKKVLGICFGHQVLSRALGGKVGKFWTGWDLGLRKVKTVKDVTSRLGFLDSSDEIPDSLVIIECHQDEVLEVPNGSDQMIAYSEMTGVEMFALGQHIMGIRGHPEYNKDILFNLVDRLLTSASIDKVLAEEENMKLERAEPERKQWGKICRKFLKSNVVHRVDSPQCQESNMKVSMESILVRVEVNVFACLALFLLFGWWSNGAHLRQTKL